MARSLKLFGRLAQFAPAALTGLWLFGAASPAYAYDCISIEWNTPSKGFHWVNNRCNKSVTIELGLMEHGVNKPYMKFVSACSRSQANDYWNARHTGDYEQVEYPEICLGSSGTGTGAVDPVPVGTVGRNLGQPGQPDPYNPDDWGGVSLDPRAKRGKDDLQDDLGQSIKDLM